MRSDKDSKQTSRVHELTLACCNDCLSEEDAQELSLLLESSPAARIEYWKSIAVHTQIPKGLAGASANEEGLPPLLEDAPQSNSNKQTSAAKWWLGIAAALVIGVLGGRAIWEPVPTGRREVAFSSPVVGSLKPLGRNTNWSLGRPGGPQPGALRQGDTIWLDRGAVEIQLANKTQASLQSPGILQVISMDRVRVIQGDLKVRVADANKPFAVETDDAEVGDLGAEFSVSVNEGKTELVVFDGEVDLKYTDSSSKDRLVKRFYAGQAVQVDQSGTLSRVVNVQQPASELGIDASYKPVIGRVRDNVSRPGVYSFYEVVPGGMREDVKAFVDRPHEWNGYDSFGMPAYLVGGDLIRTFNSDKVTEDITLSVRIHRSAALYVLLDSRVLPPKWLTDRFENTGDIIGLDEVTMRADGTPANIDSEIQVGPGESVEHTFHIWKTLVEKGQSISLGPNGANRYDEVNDAYQGVRSRTSMYGIVALAREEI